MKKLLLAFVFIGSLVKGQSFQFAKKFCANISKGYSIITDSFGNVYTTGEFNNGADFDPGPGTYTISTGAGNFYSNIFISKLDVNGNFLWAKAIGGGPSSAWNYNHNVGFSLSIDAIGNLYITGEFQGDQVDFDPGPGTFTMSTINNMTTQTFILKLDNAGNFIWAKSFNNANNHANSIVLDGSSNIYLTGFAAYQTDFDTGSGTYTLSSVGAYISKLDNNGNFLWAKILSSNISGNSEGISLKLDSFGNILASGNFSGLCDFDPGPGTYTLDATPWFTSNNTFILKLDPLGNFIWARQFSNFSNGQNYPLSMCLDNFGNVIVTGDFGDTIDFDPLGSSYPVLAIGTTLNFYIAKLDPLGNLLWAKGFGGALYYCFGNTITTDAGNNIYAVGYYDGNVDFDPGVSTYTLAFIGGAYILRLTSSGNFISAKAFQNIGNIRPLSTYLDATGSLFTTGYFDAADFDPGPGTYSLAGCPADAFVSKICFQPDNPSAISGSSLICAGDLVSFSVSPVTAASGYSWSAPNTATIVSGQNTNSINVIFTPTLGNIVLTASNSCGSSLFSSISVSVNPLPTLNTTNSNSLICIGQTGTLTATGANTYTWSSGGNSATEVISPTITTTYTVNGTDANGCSNSSSITQSVSSCTGLNTLAGTLESTLQIFPNPNNGILNVLSTSLISEIQILNTLGQVVYQSTVTKQHSSINIQQLSNGIYFVKVLEGNEVIGMQKLIKE